MYEDLLKSKGYILSELPSYYIETYLTNVTYKKGSNIVVLEYNDEGEVESAWMTSPVVNCEDEMSFGIYLVKSLDDYHRHSLELFEYCLEMSESFGGYLEHEKKIMDSHLKNLDLVKPIIDVLQECDFFIEGSSLFNKASTNSPDVYLSLGHPNFSGRIIFLTDCLTGELRVSPENLTEMFGKDKEEVKKILKERFFSEDPLAFGYLENSEETIETHEALTRMFAALRYGEKAGNIIEDEGVIPQKYSEDLEKYRNLPDEL